MTTEATCQQPLLLPFNGHYLGERGSTSSILSPLYYLLLKRTSWDWWNGFCVSDVLPTTKPSVLKHRREHKPHPFFIHNQMEKVLFLSFLLSGWLSGNSLRQTVHTHRASVHQAAKLVAALLRVARVTAGLEESNGSLPPSLWLMPPAG